MSPLMKVICNSGKSQTRIFVLLAGLQIPLKTYAIPRTNNILIITSKLNQEQIKQIKKELVTNGATIEEFKE